jgi:hypothetical protein
MTFALILAAWAAGAAALVVGAMRFGAWLDGKSDPDRRTRWNRETTHAAKHESRPE